MEQTLCINLTVKETELILNALAKFPYNEVSAIITTISKQAKDQLEPPVAQMDVNDPNLESVN